MVSQAERQKFIREEIKRARESEDDAWKLEFYKHSANFLSKNEFVEGGQLTLFCRKMGMDEPHHHNVWGAMIASLQKLGWIVKVGSVKPTTKHTHIGAVARWQSKLFK